MRYLRYYGETESRDGHQIRAEIHQTAVSAYTPMALSFAAETGLSIEWPETDKMEPVQPSTCTLTVMSDSDRQLLDLGDTANGDVLLKVFRDGNLYWTGTLDAEAYEEPYTRELNYEVSLTFEDFGPLKLLKWTRSGVESWNAILQAALDASGIEYTAVTRHISTQNADGTSLNLDRILLNNANFYDEDGDPMTILEVLECILQPFALRIIQRAGKLWLYDLNALAGLSPAEVVPSGDDAVLSYDSIYSTATVTFSPYSTEKALDETMDYKGGSGEETRYIDTGYGTNEDPDPDVPIGFVIDFGGDAGGVQLDDSGSKFFKMESRYSSGVDGVGVLWGFKNGYSSLEEGGASIKQIGHAAVNSDDYFGHKVFTVSGGYLNSLSPDQAAKYKLRINMDFLFDPRYNPFESAGERNEEDNYKEFESHCRFAYVPMMVKLKDAQGNVIKYLANFDVVTSDNIQTWEHRTRWVNGAPITGAFYLAYYNSDRSKTGLGGWATNKRCIGHFTDDLPETWTRMEDGEYVEYPSEGGYLEIEVYAGVRLYYRRDWYTDNYDKIRWTAYKCPTVTVVKQDGLDVASEDQDDVARLSEIGHEQYSLETIIGTLSEKVSPATARGLLYNTAGVPIGQFRREGVTDRLERLLLGTVYSQYAVRRKIISGTMELMDGPSLLLSDRATEGVFIPVAENQNLLDDESVLSMVQVVKDNYYGIEYE